MNIYKDIIKNNKIIPEKRYKYCIKYIDYMCACQIKDGNTDRQEIYNYVNKKLNGSVKKSTFLLYLDKHFDGYDQLTLTKDQIYSIDMVNRVNLLSSKYIINENIKSLLNKLHNIRDIAELLAIVIQYYKNKGVIYDSDYIGSVIYDLYNNYDKYYVKYDVAINNIDSSIGIDDLLLNSYIQSLLKELNINTIDDLSFLDVNLLMAMFIYDNTVFLNNVCKKNNYDEIYNNITNKLDKIVSSFSDAEIDVINLRSGLDKRKVTLEELGMKYKVTKERIRQVEKRTIKKIVDLANEINLLDDISLVFDILHTRDQYVLSSELIRCLGEASKCSIIKIYLNSIDSNIQFSNIYKIITNDQYVDLDTIINNKVDSLPDILSCDDYNEYDQFTQLVIINNFLYSKNRYYIKHNYNFSDILFRLVDDLFPNGYRIQNDSDYIKLRDEYLKKYRFVKEFPSMHSIQASLERTDVCLIDKGTLLPYNKANHLTDSLTNKIINYISDIDGMIFYNSIFEQFKDELLKIGITNRYYLKGNLDRKLPKEYKTKRDYISYKNKFVSSNEAINKEISKSKGIIYINDLTKKFPGCKEYIFNTIFNERKDNIFLGNHRYILLKNIKFSNKLRNTIIDEIENTFVNLKTDIIHINKVYTKMMVLHKELMSQVPYIDNVVGFNNLVENKLSDQYYFSYRYISKEDKENITALSIINKHFVSMDKFSTDDIKRYINKVGIRIIFSYQRFLILFSDNFVQVDQSIMVKKEFLNIDSGILKSIQKELEYYVNSFGEINTSSYKGYASLPKVQCQWNKYLLVGVVRTYLSDIFDIEYTDSNFKQTDYIIRRTK